MANTDTLSSAIRHNVARLRSRLPGSTRFIAVVKADAYGHGARPVAAAALEAGAWGLAVVTLAEAAEVSDLLPPERLLVMGPLLPEDAAEAAAAGCAVGCSSFEVAQALAAAAGARRVPVHLKLDTGMARYGAQPGEFAALARLVEESDGLELAGTWTHQVAKNTMRVSVQPFGRLSSKVTAQVRARAKELARALAQPKVEVTFN